MQKILIFILIAIGLSNCTSKDSESKKESEPKTEVPESPGIDYAKYGISKQSIGNLKPIQVGNDAPDFSGIDQQGNSIQLSELVEAGDVVLIFYRGFWCGYCTKYLAEFADRLDELKEKGASVIAVAPEGENNIAKTIEDTKLPIPFISDSDGSIMRKYGVEFMVTEELDKKFFDSKGFSLAEANDRESGILPIPATYIIGKDRNVKWVHFDPDYSQRASIEDIFANL